MSKHVQIGNEVEWESTYCGRHTQHSGTILDHVQKANVIWAVIKKPDGKSTMIQSSRLTRSVLRKHNVQEISHTS